MDFFTKSADKVKGWMRGGIPARVLPEPIPEPVPPPQGEPRHLSHPFSSIDLEALSKILLAFCEENRNSLMVCGSGGLVLSIMYHSTVMRTALIFGGGLFAYHQYASSAKPSTPEGSANPTRPTL